MATGGRTGQKVEPGRETVLRSPEAVQVDRIVPPSGNLAVAGQQFWFEPKHAGQPVRLWVDSTMLHVSIDGERIKTVLSRLSTADLVRLRASEDRSAGRAPGRLAVRVPVEVARTVNASGVVGLAGQQITVGVPLAGRRVIVRLDGPLLKVIADDVVVRTLPRTTSKEVTRFEAYSTKNRTTG
ncbi:hypothetical protein ACFU96_30445 [Streptomyces sp. NPDC057620]|uniref:hypothetical protein n=1 Tax=Streptomyces sp. NPDC057620 TaxID=3346185 RepID=UPI00368957EC